jgi:hypothetical protein
MLTINVNKNNLLKAQAISFALFNVPNPQVHFRNFLCPLNFTSVISYNVP